MKKAPFIPVVAVILLPALSHATVGDSYTSFKKSGFARFFRVREVERQKAKDGDTLVRCKPGGFKKYNDILLYLGTGGEVNRAILRVDRRWLGRKGRINPFAKDLVKSFLKEMICAAGNRRVRRLVQKIWRAGNRRFRTLYSRRRPLKIALFPNMEKAYQVFLGARKSQRSAYSACTLMMANRPVGGRERLEVQIVRKALDTGKSSSAGKAAAAGRATFLTAIDLAPWNLRPVQESPKLGLKAWMNTSRGAPIFRLVDIRWTFNSPGAARRFHQKNLQKNSERARAVAAPPLQSFVRELKVFRKGPGSPILKALGLSMNMYYFIFRVKAVVAKVFVSGTGNLTLKQAARIARKAAARIKGARQG